MCGRAAEMIGIYIYTHCHVEQSQITADQILSGFLCFSLMQVREYMDRAETLKQLLKPHRQREDALEQSQSFSADEQLGKLLYRQQMA